jgi:transcriptional regulator with XRE-family HTH domain
MNRIKEVLDEKGIKQTWLADKLGKSYNMVNSYVQNRQQPRLEILYQIADILEVEISELLIEKAKYLAETESKYKFNKKI